MRERVLVMVVVVLLLLLLLLLDRMVETICVQCVTWRARWGAYWASWANWLRLLWAKDRMVGSGPGRLFVVVGEFVRQRRRWLRVVHRQLCHAHST